LLPTSSQFSDSGLSSQIGLKIWLFLDDCSSQRGQAVAFANGGHVSQNQRFRRKVRYLKLLSSCE